MPTEISIYFILPSHCEDELGTTELMQEAFEACRTYHMIPEWIRENDLSQRKFEKKDIVVFETFEGEVFDKFSTHKCLSIVGPRCLLSVLTDGVPIPNNGSPIYNMAMCDMKICLSNFPPEKKKELRTKIELMGGIFSLSVTSSVKYLVASGVKSQKYMTAASSGLPVMAASWVEAVWQESLKRQIKATDPELFDAHKLPAFDQLLVSTTGLLEQERIEIKTLIEANGGTFNGKMCIKKTHMLICKSGVNSQKFTVALKHNIPCVSTKWVFDSVEAGVALKEDGYLIKSSASSSTPTKTGIPDLNFSSMSVISGPHSKHFDDNVTSLNSTNMSIFCNASSVNQTLVSKTTAKKDTKENLIMEIDLKCVKSAGHFLDGCGIYLAGFSAAAREKLCRILKISGATRYDDVSDRITQVIAGDTSSHELKFLTSKGCMAPIVSVEWLLESIKLQQPASEDKFQVTVKGSPANVAPSSPSVKKGLNLLRSHTSTSEPKKDSLIKCLNFDAEPSDTIMKQYLSKAKEEEDTLARFIAQGNLEESKKKEKEQTKTESVKEPPKTNMTTTLEEEETTLPIFRDKCFILLEFTDEFADELIFTIEQRCGIVKSPKYNGIPDYAVVPIFVDKLNVTASEIVTYLWVGDCDRENELLTPQYYHQPVVGNISSKPLQNCAVTVSNYNKSERYFLGEILKHLGAVYQELFSKVDQTNIKASTHLVCKTATGKKYTAALSWGIPVITARWVLECLKLDCKADEKLFGIGEHDEEIEPDIMQIKAAILPKEPPRNSDYFPSTSKHNMSKLDITITKEQDKSNKTNSKVTPQTSPFVGFEQKTIEKSKLLHEEIHKELQENNDATDALINKHQSQMKETRSFNFTLEMPEFDHSKESFLGDKNKNKSEVICETPGPSKPVTKLGNEPCKENVEKGDGYIEIDGKKMLLSEYMQGLRDQGLFECGSPADRYNVSPYVVPNDLIAEKVTTPKSLHSNLNANDSFQPSQDTPVGKYIKGLQQRNVLPGTAGRRESTPDSPLPKSQFDVSTPNTPLGAFLGNHDPSPETRKYWQRRINRFPHYNIHDRPPPKKERRLSTPLSEVKRQAWAMLLANEKDPPVTPDVESANKKLKMHSTFANDSIEDQEQIEKPKETESQIAENLQVTNQLKQIQNLMRSNESSGNRRGSLLRVDSDTPQRMCLSHRQTSLFNDAKDSQPDTIGWDDPVLSELTQKTSEAPRKFMLSTISPDLKPVYEEIISNLNGSLSATQNFDATATHLVCAVPSRNEKVLSSMASGKFIIHTSYLTDSKEAGKFLSEESYEFGNPKSMEKIKVEVKPGLNLKSYYWWRQRIAEKKHGAFHDWRVVLFAGNKMPLVRLVEAGGGVIVNASPPFTHNIDATHCLIDFKLNLNMSDFIPLAKQGIPCLNIIFLSYFLNTLGEPNLKEYIPPELQDYY